ncbi:70 kDa peptidyl-prolyl isomerase [Bienertia sinuspersici]
MEGNYLMEEENTLINLIRNSENAKSVLGLAKDLKEEGNTLFKQRKVDDALEKYGHTGVILARFGFVEEKDRVELHELPICILLNFVACLSKKKEFIQVGQICSIILDFKPNNIKAFFRRVLCHNLHVSRII